MHYSLCNFLPQTRDANGCYRHPSSPRKLLRRTRKVSESLGMVRSGVWVGAGHGVPLEARPPCGEHSPRPRHAKWLFEHAKTAKTFIPRRHVHITCSLRWCAGAGLAGGGGGVLLVAVCGTPSCRSLRLPRDMAVKWPLRRSF